MFTASVIALVVGVTIGILIGQSALLISINSKLDQIVKKLK